VAKDSLERR